MVKLRAFCGPGYSGHHCVRGQEHPGKLVPLFSILVTKEATEKLGILIKSSIFILDIQKTQATEKQESKAQHKHLVRAEAGAGTY